MAHLDYSPTDAQQLASAAGHRVYLWQVGDRPRVRHNLEHPAAIEQMQYSADGRWLLTSAGDRRLRLWDANSGKLHQEMAVSTKVARMVMGDRRIAALGNDNSIQVWEQATGDRIARLKLPSIIAAQPEFHAAELALNPKEDQLIVVLGQQGWNWNLTTQQLQSRFQVFAEAPNLPEEVFEPNDPLEASLLHQARPKPRRPQQPQPSMQVFARPTLRFSPDGAQLLATRQREIQGQTILEAQLLNLHSGQVRDVLPDQRSAVVASQFSADSRLLVTVNQAGQLNLWDAQGRSPRQSPWEPFSRAICPPISR
ncbi:MAG: WD40 repeat domain-containing protein [Synechococcales cyanobacterium RM1_1_8]|nr:WD40 repeat domain-containing protein [Synechococcales cyanobacterium RM1_1_8]